MVVEINQRFREVYGWSDEQLIGQSLGLILPPSFRPRTTQALLRFQLTEVSKVLNHPLTLATFCSDGRAIESEHYIVAEKTTTLVGLLRQPCVRCKPRADQT